MSEIEALDELLAALRRREQALILPRKGASVDRIGAKLMEGLRLAIYLTEHQRNLLESR